MSQNDLFVTVIIATYNRNEVLCNSIRSVLAQKYAPFELIIVDQSKVHTPETSTFLKDHQNCFRYISIETPGLPNARNVGIEAAKGSVILFCDDDVEVAPGWIANHVKNYEQDAAIACVGGRILEEGLPVKPNEINNGYINFLGRPKGNFTSTIPSLVKTVRGGNMSFRRSVLDEVGFFDTKFIGTATLEETDLSYRILSAGYKVVYDPKAELLHRPQPDGNIGWRNHKRIAWYHNYLHNGTLFMLKNKPRYEVPFFLLAQFSIALKHGFLVNRSIGDFRYILSGVLGGLKRYQSSLS